MTHSHLVFCALLSPFALLLIEGCSSSTTTTSTGSGGSTSSSTSDATTGSTTSTGTGGAGTGGALACQQQCAIDHATGLQAFNDYQFQECGCPTDADAGAPPCATDCAAECLDPSTLMATTPCGMCLSAEKAKGGASSCTIQAAILNPNDCQSNKDCTAFLTCVQACPK